MCCFPATAAERQRLKLGWLSKAGVLQPFHSVSRSACSSRGCCIMHQPLGKSSPAPSASTFWRLAAGSRNSSTSQAWCSSSQGSAGHTLLQRCRAPVNHLSSSYKEAWR